MVAKAENLHWEYNISMHLLDYAGSDTRKRMEGKKKGYQSHVRKKE